MTAQPILDLEADVRVRSPVAVGPHGHLPSDDDVERLPGSGKNVIPTGLWSGVRVGQLRVGAFDNSTVMLNPTPRARRRRLANLYLCAMVATRPSRGRGPRPRLPGTPRGAPRGPPHRVPASRTAAPRFGRGAPE